jgi:hypothetical protein
MTKRWSVHSKKDPITAAAAKLMKNQIRKDCMEEAEKQ